MALINDPRLYSGGSERLDSRPHTQLYAQLMQRKQAKEDALDQYYQNLHKSINPAGMRTKDIEGGWSKKVQDWNDFGVQNNARIRSPKTPEDRALANKFMGMYQDILMDTSKSKEAGAQEMELAKQKISGKWNPTQDDLDIADNISASIYDKQYYKDPDIRTKPYTLNDLSLNVPQVTPKEQEEFYKAAVGNLKPGKTYDETKSRRDKISGQVFIPYQQSYEQDAVKKIGDNAGVLFPGNRTPIGVHYEKLLHDPNFFEEANQAYQSVYGKDEIVDTPKKAAQAAAIMNTRADVSTGEELRKDEDLAFQRQKEMQAIRNADAKGLLRLRDSLKDEDEATNDLWYDKFIDAITEEAKAQPSRLYAGAGLGWEIPLNAFLNKSLAKDGKSPDKLVVTTEGMYVPIFYKRDADGGIEVDKNTGIPKENKTYTTPNSREKFKVDMGGKTGVKQLNKEMSAGQQSNGTNKGILD